MSCLSTRAKAGVSQGEREGGEREAIGGTSHTGRVGEKRGKKLGEPLTNEGKKEKKDGGGEARGRGGRMLRVGEGKTCKGERGRKKEAVQ